MENQKEIEKTDQAKGADLAKVAVEPIYGYTLTYESRLELMHKAVTVFATLEALKHGEVKIRKKLIEVLTFYSLNGYNKATKDMIIETMEISSDNLTQINSELSKSGYLIRDTNNLRKKTLHPDLERLKNVFITDSPTRCKRAMIIRFDD